MGTLARVVVYADSPEQAHEAMRAAFARIREIDDRLSDYKPDSESSRLSTLPAGRAVPVSMDLFAVLEVALRMSQLTGGAFDVTVGRLTKQWRNGEAVSGRGRWREVKLDSSSRKVTLKGEGIGLDFGGIAKGYAAEEMVRAMKAKGCPRAMAAVSGDIVVGGAPPGAAGWRIGLGSTERVAVLSNRGISTSGETEQFVERDGVKYSHILDARTGAPLRSGPSVTVVARSGMEADALATALRVLGEEKGRAVVSRMAGAEVHYWTE